MYIIIYLVVRITANDKAVIEFFFLYKVPMWYYVLTVMRSSLNNIVVIFWSFRLDNTKYVPFVFIVIYIFLFLSTFY